jgi:hypothetical protein
MMKDSLHSHNSNHRAKGFASRSGIIVFSADIDPK